MDGEYVFNKFKTNIPYYMPYQACVNRKHLFPFRQEDVKVCAGSFTCLVSCFNGQEWHIVQFAAWCAAWFLSEFMCLSCFFNLKILVDSLAPPLWVGSLVSLWVTSKSSNGLSTLISITSTAGLLSFNPHSSISPEKSCVSGWFTAVVTSLEIKGRQHYIESSGGWLRTSGGT